MIFSLVTQAIVGFIMSGLYTKLTEHIAAFAVFYGIFLSLGEAGPGNNLGLLASKSVLDYRFLCPCYISIIPYCFVPIRKDARLLVYKFSSLVFRRLNHSLLS